MTERTSTQRDAIVKVLMSTTTHPSAEWVYEQVRKEMPGIGLATVYRNLRLLRDEGSIQELPTRSAIARYDGNTCLHYHFYCHRCDRIIDLDEPIDATIESKVAANTGLEVTGHHMEFSGLCRECQQSAAQQERHV